MLSLIQSMLPSEGTLEAANLNRQSVQTGCCLFRERQSEIQSKSGLSAKIAKLLLLVAKETADAILESRYKYFDALVKNFGCQITAVEIHALAQRNGLQEEAERIRRLVEDKLSTIPVQPSKCEGVHTIRDYIERKCNIQFEVSPEMSRLLRLRMLCIVNTNIEKAGREVARTDVSLLGRKVSKNTNHKLENLLKIIVSGLQAEESRHAVHYLKEAAVRSLPRDNLRCSIIIDALQLERSSEVYDINSQTPIVSVPLMHNMEASLASIAQGIVCIKNKLAICGKPIADARPLTVFIKLQNETLLSEAEIKELPPELPVFVVEGYIRNDVKIQELFGEGRFLNLVRANCAILPQYASGASKDKVGNEQVAADIAAFASSAFDRAREIMEIDHTYCASIREER